MVPVVVGKRHTDHENQRQDREYHDTESREEKKRGIKPFIQKALYGHITIKLGILKTEHLTLQLEIMYQLFQWL